MKRTRWIAAIALAYSLGCSTMIFENGKVSTVSEDPGEKWHHIGVFQLVEFSSPMDLNEYCEGKDWTRIEVEREFVQSLITGIAGGIYEPMHVDYSCSLK